MTDYSVWIYAMLAVGALITAAVVYTLSQPSDLPYLKKKQASYLVFCSETFVAAIFWFYFEGLNDR